MSMKAADVPLSGTRQCPVSTPATIPDDMSIDEKAKLRFDLANANLQSSADREDKHDRHKHRDLPPAERRDHDPCAMARLESNVDIHTRHR